MAIISNESNPLERALHAQKPIWDEFCVELGKLDAGWRTARAFYDDTAAVDDFLEYERSHHRHMDDKTCAALMIIDYCYVLIFATIPLVAGSGIVPDLAPERIALRMFTDKRTRWRGAQSSPRRYPLSLLAIFNRPPGFWASSRCGTAR